MQILKIRHDPIIDIKEAEKHYSEKDGVDVKYICTTDLEHSDLPMDIFFRETPHPQFGNRYFGLFFHPKEKDIRIIDADIVESFTFGMIQDTEGIWYYSQSHHDFKMIGDKMIDGGRVYTRGSLDIVYFEIKDGIFVKNEKSEISP